MIDATQVAGSGSQGVNQTVISSSITSLLCSALFSSLALRSSILLAGFGVGGGSGGDFGAGGPHADTMKVVRSKRTSQGRVRRTMIVSPVLLMLGATRESLLACKSQSYCETIPFGSRPRSVIRPLRLALRLR